MDQIKPVVYEKHEFEKRLVSNLKILSRYFLDSKFLIQEKKSKVWNWFDTSWNLSTENWTERIEQVFEEFKDLIDEVFKKEWNVSLFYRSIRILAQGTNGKVFE